MKRAWIFIPISLAVFSQISFALPQQNATVSDKDIEVRIFEDARYPPLAYMARIQGVVTVNVKLDPNGHVSEAAASSGPELLVPPSIENAKKWVFKPNLANAAVIVYNYRILEGRCNHNSSLFILQGPNLATVLACPPIVNESSSDK
jgi:TonB family protein